MSAEDRWQRLADQITAEVLAVKVDRYSYPGGVTRSISQLLEDGRVVEVHDRWWRKNDDVWIGYAVHVEGHDGIVKRWWPNTKKRSEVIAAIREAVLS